MLKKYFSSSIGKKQTVAVTGFMLILFLIMHLAGNCFIYAGPETFNKYAATLESLGPVLKLIEWALTAVFAIHIAFTAMVVIENKKSRPVGYAASHYKERSLATRLMPYTGIILLVYICTHLFDFTFADTTTAISIFQNHQLGLYGLVVRSFMNPIKLVWYLIAMSAVGFHLSHAIQSLLQTFGVSHPAYTSFFRKLSLGLGVGIALGFSIIPLYVWFYIVPTLI